MSSTMSTEQVTTSDSRIGTSYELRHTPRALDEKYYTLEPDESSFFKTYTGINDDEELKKHIVKVQKDAYAVSPLPWFNSFNTYQ